MSTKKTPKFILNAEGANPVPHIGEMLRNYYKEKRIYQSSLARALNRRHSTVSDYKKRPSIQIAILWELCHVLKRNFFADIAAQLPDTFPTNAAASAPAETASARIAELEQEVSILQRERDLLKELLKR